MSQIPALDPQMPQRSTQEIHQAALDRLRSMRTFMAGSKKADIEAYLNWLNEKVALYEQDTARWQDVLSGAKITSIDDYFHEAAAESNRELAAVRNEKSKARQDIASLENREQQIRAQISNLERDLLAVTESANEHDVGFYEYDHPARDAERFKSELASVKTRAKALLKEKKATLTRGTEGFTYNNSASEGKKFVKDFSTLMLTAYNQEAENVLIRMDKTRDKSTAIARLDKAAEKIEKMGTMIDIRVNPAYHRLRLQEIEIAFKYKEAQEQAKEAAKEEAARLREEKKVRDEFEKKIKEAEAEEKKARDELARLMARQQQHYSNVAGALPQDDPKIAELEAKIAALEGAKADANERLMRTNAGYVYVISNIGAFGEGIVKIGMTRRLDPDDRVKELSGASVPFKFDVHALHFSDDAFGLETSLHRKFKDRKVNKVNGRKEFFRVTPEEVRQALVGLSHDVSTLEFQSVPEAIEYRQTLELEAGNRGH